LTFSNSKKYRRFLKFKIKIYILSIINFFLKKINYNILPTANSFDTLKTKYSEASRTFYFLPNKNKINIYKIDTSNLYSELCFLGQKHNVDKSPYSKTWHRHSYTGVYDLIFSSFKDQKFNFAEIGVYKNNSIRMFREYFKNAYLYAFDFNQKYLENARKQKLKKTKYSFIDVTKNKSIHHNFLKIKKKFKLIIDDSSHSFDDQIRIIKICKDFLEPGGFLVIEDIFLFENIEYKFKKELKNYLSYFIKFDFIDCNHINQYSKGWITNNDKILIIQKSFDKN